MPGDANSDTPDRLDAVGATYTRGSRQDRAIRELIVRTFAPYLSPSDRALQLGFSEGIDTELLSPLVGSLDVVEGSRTFHDALAARSLPGVRPILSMFEDFTLPVGEAPYDAVFAVYVLEHVAEPATVLAMARRVLRPGGRLFAVVPNARALSRQLAVHMGLLSHVHELTAHDLDHGHRRVYDRPSFNRDIEGAGFNIVAQGGVMLKILADFQLDELMELGILGAAQIDGLYRLGLEHPDLCGSLFSICGAGNGEGNTA
jgi:SAM-dependent methyltransferase